VNISTAFTNPKIACEVGFVIGLIITFITSAIVNHIHWKKFDKELKEMIGNINKTIDLMNKIQ
jgi:hypothetical protein